MGFEYHLYKMERATMEQIVPCSYMELESLYGEDGWLYSGHLPMERLHSNGDLDAEEVERIQAYGTRLLTSVEVDDTELEDVLYLTKGGLEEWITIYRERVQNGLKNMLEKANEDDEELEERRKHYVESLLQEWTRSSPVHLDPTNGLTHSARYEYLVFELAYLHKTLKDNEVLVFCGH